MKKIFFSILVLSNSLHLISQSKQFDIFTCTPPKGFILNEDKTKLYYSKTEGKNYCQLFLFPAVTGTSDVEKDFKINWDFFARNAEQGVGDPVNKEEQEADGWKVIQGGAGGVYGGKPFVISVTTLTKDGVTFYIAAVFSDEKYITAVKEFTGSITPDINKYVKNSKQLPANPSVQTKTVATISNGISITKTNTNFDDGWHATALADYVQLKKEKTEVKIFYVDDKLDNAKSNMVDAPEYYWSHYVTPFYKVPSPEKWSGVSYPVVYFMEGQATELNTGRSCYVAIKIVYAGGANVILSITPDKNTLKQQFPHPDDMDRMLGYNKFAVTEKDVLGKWKSGTGGGIANYYNVYTGGYAYTVSLSTTDDFEFSADNSYHSEHNSASSNSAGTTFAALKYQGKFSVTDWELYASNRVEGKSKKFLAQFVAVKGGFLLQLTDSDYIPLVYTLFKVP